MSVKSAGCKQALSKIVRLFPLFLLIKINKEGGRWWVEISSLESLRYLALRGRVGVFFLLSINCARSLSHKRR